MTHTLILQDIQPVTHDTNRLTFPKPSGFSFSPGQATELSLDRDGWRDEGRPFTFTSRPDEDRLEFTIKSYPSHDGVTEQVGGMSAGDAVLIGDVWGAIEDRGPGTIIAGGAGLTPFLSILRTRLAEKGSLDGYKLIFANSTARDIILRSELEAMPGLETVFVLSDEDAPGTIRGKVDGALLDAQVGDFSGTFYVCGPPPMEDDLTELLTERGVTGERLVKEDH